MIASYPMENPTIENGCVFLDNGITISNCTITDNGSIKGIATDTDTNETIKAYYNINKKCWFFGADNIRKSNLITLDTRTDEEKKAISLLGVAKSQQRKQEKKNFNELAKAMLEQTLTEKQVSEILGTSTNMLLDNSVGSVMLARMIQGAMDGSFKCAEFVRDTAGFKPKNEIEVQADIMTDADRALMDKLNARIG